MNILFLRALPDDGFSQVLIKEDGSLDLLFSGCANTQSALIPLLRNTAKVKVDNLLLSTLDLRQSRNMQKPDVIFNEISEPDSHKKALGMAHKLIQQIQCPVINAPDKIANTRRETLAEILSPLSQVQVPKTLRCQPKSPKNIQTLWQNQFAGKPIIIRAAGDHGGSSTERLNNEQDLELLHQFALDGRDYLISKFMDYADSDGLYRKYRFALIDGQVILRHIIVSDYWMIHSRSRDYMNQHPEYYEEEQALLDAEAPSLPDGVLAILAQMNHLFQVDYLGIDCHINDKGEILVFELNANMNILINNPEQSWRWEKNIQRIAQTLNNLILRKAKQ